MNDKEKIDELLKQLKHEHDLYKKHLKVYEDENAKLIEQDQIISQEIKTYIQIAEKLQAENAKLRECLEFTTHAAEYLYKPDVKLNRGMSPTFYFTLTYEGDLELMEKTKRARQVLKELDLN